MIKCKNGHPLNNKNFYISKAGRKVCRMCKAMWSKKWRRKHPKYLKNYRRKNKNV